MRPADYRHREGASMITASDFEDLATGVWDNISQTTKSDAEGYHETSGSIALRSHDALVGFYIYRYPRGAGWTGLTYVKDGRFHRRIWRRAFRRRTLYRLARTFLDNLGVERVR